MTLVGNLVDADAPQTGEPIDSLLGVSPDPSHDRPDGAPGDPHQFTHRGFRARHRQPGHRVIEGKRVPGVMARPPRRHTPLRGRPRATTSSAPSSSANSTSSITVRRSTPNSPRHNLTLRTSLPAPLVPDP